MLAAAFFISLIPQSLAQVFTERMLNGVVQSMVLAAAVWLLLKVVGRRSASTRFRLWFVALLASAGLPWIGLLGSAPGGQTVGTPRAALVVPGSFGAYLFGAWAVVSFLLLARVVLGLWQIHYLRKGCTPVDIGSLDPALRHVLEDACSRRVALYASDSLRVPMATGFFRPMIVLPAWALRELSTEQLRVTLLHEAAHLHRRDDWTNLAQKVLRALFFFHPVVWWIEGKLALEREIACDELVVAATSSPRAYAECLVALAEKSLGRRTLAFAQAAVSHMRHTSLRIKSILRGDRSPSTGMGKPVMALVAALVIVCFVSAGHLPKLVAFVDADGSGGTARPAMATIAAVHVSEVGHRPIVFRSEDMPAESVHRFVRKAAASAKSVVSPRESLVAEMHPNGNAEGAGTPVVAGPVILGAVGSEAQLAVPNSLFARPVPASFRAVAASETVFVVMQGQQINAAGDRVVRFNIYRLTVFYPELDPRSSREALSKSI